MGGCVCRAEIGGVRRRGREREQREGAAERHAHRESRAGRGVLAPMPHRGDTRGADTPASGEKGEGGSRRPQPPHGRPAPYRAQHPGGMRMMPHSGSSSPARRGSAGVRVREGVRVCVLLLLRVSSALRIRLSGEPGRGSGSALSFASESCGGGLRWRGRASCSGRRGGTAPGRRPLPALPHSVPPHTSSTACHGVRTRRRE